MLRLVYSGGEEEFEKFADFPYNITILKGTEAKKKEQLASVLGEGLQIVIVNYESAWRLEKKLFNFRADIICADEGHKIKEGRTQQAKALHNLADHTKYRCLLTGTLKKKNPVDDLKRAVIKRGVRESFESSDEKLFKAFVDHAVLWSKEKTQFYFTCGLVAEEETNFSKRWTDSRTGWRSALRCWQARCRRTRSR